MLAKFKCNQRAITRSFEQESIPRESIPYLHYRWFYSEKHLSSTCGSSRPCKSLGEKINCYLNIISVKLNFSRDAVLNIGDSREHRWKDVACFES